MNSITLPERYVLDEVIGTGATSRVYSAHDTVLDAPRAVKILKTGKDSNFATRLIREAKAMASARHPNILQVYDTGVLTDGRAWIVMDLAETSMASVISSNGPFSTDEALRLGIQILRGLQAAHDVGVIHRDIKPQNVLLSARNDALLADFGIAAVADNRGRDTDVDVTLGTFAYMPPEQRMNARTVGPAADQYAAAATIYQALTAASPVDLFACPEDSVRWQGVPKPLGDVLRRALAYRAEERFPSCADLAECLESLRSGTPMRSPTFISMEATLTPAPTRDSGPANITAAIEHLYRHSLRDRLQGLLDTRDSAIRGNAEARSTVSRIAHSLRGSGSTYGFPLITERATVLEDMLRDPSQTEIAPSIAALINGIQAILTQTTGDKHRLLVAVGDPVASGVLQVALQRSDRSVIAVDTVAAARKVLEARPVAGAIIDLVLPDADGRALLDDVRLRAVPTVVIASGVSDGLRAELMAHGANAVYAKPIDPVGVASAMSSLLAKAIDVHTVIDTATGLPDQATLRDALILAHGSTHPNRSVSIAHIMVPTDAVLADWATQFREEMPVDSLVSGLGFNEIGVMLHQDGDTTADVVVRAAKSANNTLGLTSRFAVGVAEAGGSSVADVLVSASRMANHAQSHNVDVTIAEPETHPQGRVLIAEDDPATAALVVRLLGEDGLSVTRAADGERAADFLRDASFDLLLLDVYLPGRDGFSLLQYARELPHHARTPVVMLTAVGDERQVARAFELGADDYVVKPFRPLELKARVRRLLRRPTD
jgi:DNA-binding response OmpR family regulator/serine/threonine protein kinase